MWTKRLFPRITNARVADRSLLTEASYDVLRKIKKKKGSTAQKSHICGRAAAARLLTSGSHWL